jgi:regulatory protein
VGGRFRMKQWGRVKIKYELKQKQVSEYVIKKALKMINEEDYWATAQKLYDQKLKQLKGETNLFIRKKKLQDYLLQKGYETSVISELLR